MKSGCKFPIILFIFEIPGVKSPIKNGLLDVVPDKTGTDDSKTIASPTPKGTLRQIGDTGGGGLLTEVVKHLEILFWDGLFVEGIKKLTPKNRKRKN